MAKILIVLVMLLIVYSLGSGLFYLVRDAGSSKRTVKALSWRIGLSLVLFIALLLGYGMGWITPHAAL